MSLEIVRERIERAAVEAGRDPSKIHLLAVSKGQTVERIAQCLELESFPRDLGENYLDEMKLKQSSLDTPLLTWHFLGRLQSRKIESVCEVASYIHGVSRNKELEALAQAKRVPKYFIQVNISDEPQKGGIDPSALEVMLELITRTAALETNFAGLMGMAEPLTPDNELVVRAQFASLRELRDRLCPSKLLSMGMSDDLELAVSEGADWVRVGTALFGAR